MDINGLSNVELTQFFLELFIQENVEALIELDKNNAQEVDFLVLFANQNYFPIEAYEGSFSEILQTYIGVIPFGVFHENVRR